MTDQEWPTTRVTVMEQDFDGETPVSASECPRCGALVLKGSTSKHEAVCWAPEGSGLVTPPTEDPLATERLPFWRARDLDSEYADFLHRLLESAPELGEHVVRSREDTSTLTKSVRFKTTFYGIPMNVIVERDHSA